MDMQIHSQAIQINTKDIHLTRKQYFCPERFSSGVEEDSLIKACYRREGKCHMKFSNLHN